MSDSDSEDQAVFGAYSPLLGAEGLSDWFMDTWITAAYPVPGPSTCRHPAVAVRHRLADRRYDADLSYRALLLLRVAAARATLAAFLCGGAAATGGGARACRRCRPTRRRWRCAGRCDPSLPASARPACAARAPGRLTVN